MISEQDRIKTIELAEKYVKKGKLKDAVEEYTKLLSGGAQDISIRNIICELYLKLKQKDKAVKEYHQIAGYYEERGLYTQAIAIYKKASKLSPEDMETSMKLADLYSSQGFLSEAKAEYLNIAKDLKKNNRLKQAIFVYEKIKKIDKKDMQAKFSLVELYSKDGAVGKAVEELNDIAEFKIHANAIKEAREVLIQARKLKEDHSRTLSNLIELLKRENKKKEALSLINSVLKKDKDNVRILKLLGDLYFGEQNLKKAEETFSRVVSLKPKDVEARVMLGRIDIYQDKLDHAYELYEPLIESLIKKQRVEKAIGLLGLILSAKKAYVPALEKLATIYKLRDQKKNLEVAYRVILEEYQSNNLRKESLPVLEELMGICPEDEALKKEYGILTGEFGVPEEGEKVEAPPEEEKEAVKAVEEERREKELPAEERKVEESLKEEKVVEEAPPEMKAEEVIKEEELVEKPPEEEKVVEPPEEEIKVEKAPKEEEMEEIPRIPKEGTDEMLETNLAQAEVYMEQGLVRLARRILENLRVSYPDEPRIEEKVAAISEMSGTVTEEEILQRVEKASRKEARLFEKGVDFLEEEKEAPASEANIPAEDIPSEISKERREVSYYDLKDRIDEELEAIKSVYRLQLEGNTAVAETDSGDIASEFRKVVDEHVDKEDYESRFNLGVAFLEQGLMEEAIDEFKLAANDESRAIECYSVICNCYKKKNDFKEAIKWMKKAVEYSEKGSGQYFSLKYELASIYEGLGDLKKALTLYYEINEWNSGYKDVNKKLKTLGK